MFFKWQDVWNSTYYPKADDHKNVEKKWYIVDAADKRLGRLASTIAIHIRGKDVPSFTPSTDMGAYVVVVSNMILSYHCRRAMDSWDAFDLVIPIMKL